MVKAQRGAGATSDARSWRRILISNSPQSVRDASMAGRAQRQVPRRSRPAAAKAEPLSRGASVAASAACQYQSLRARRRPESSTATGSGSRAESPLPSRECFTLRF